MGRLEFRIFARRLSALRLRLRGLYHIESQESRTDTYLLQSNPMHSFKIRADRELDLKIKLGKVGEYERWHPMGAVQLPASRADLLGAFEGAEGLPPLAPYQHYDAEQLVEAFARCGARALAVHKVRVRFTAPSVQLEIARLTGVNGSAETCSLEARAAGPINLLREELGLQSHRNESYPSWLVEQFNSKVSMV
ncbi:hypothetical protein G0P98_23700 [Yangia sp. PrR004]|nr:hypothetical protein [Salipiger sp. PrR004]